MKKGTWMFSDDQAAGAYGARPPPDEPDEAVGGRGDGVDQPDAHE
jgi:hypothetical protein